jgi:hypothetical protein
MKQISLLKRISVSVMVLSTCALVASAGQGPGGTDIFHYSTKAQMTPGVEGAAGRVDIKVREQGNAAKKDLTLRLQGLQASGDYKLFLLQVDETLETATPIFFHTDPRGRANLAYRSKATGKGKAGLPENLELHQVTSIQVIPDTTTESTISPVLAADLGEDGQFHYQVKKTVVSAGGVRGELRILSNANTTQFRLRVIGLAPGNYTLDLTAVTGTTVAGTTPYTADETGELLINGPLEPAPQVLALATIALTPEATIDEPTPVPVLTIDVP